MGCGCGPGCAFMMRWCLCRSCYCSFSSFGAESVWWCAESAPALVAPRPTVRTLPQVGWDPWAGPQKIAHIGSLGIEEAIFRQHVRAGDGRREFLGSASLRPQGGADSAADYRNAGTMPLGRGPHRGLKRAHVPPVRERRCGPGRRRRPLRRRRQSPDLGPHPRPVRLNGAGQRSVRRRHARDVRPTRRHQLSGPSGTDGASDPDPPRSRT